MAANRIQVFGRVQGVFYRASAKTTADKLGLSGWVMNLPDGTVSMEVEGDESSINQFTEWCKQGPQHARVDDIIVELAEETGAEDFEIRYV